MCSYLKSMPEFILILLTIPNKFYTMKQEFQALDLQEFFW